MGKMLKRAEILEREYWVTRLVEELLPEPDQIVYSSIKGNNLEIKTYLYTLEAVLDAEKSPGFLHRKEKIDKAAKRDAERLRMHTLGKGLKATEIIEKKRAAIQQDIENLKVPVNTTAIAEVFQYCKGRMILYRTFLSSFNELFISELEVKHKKNKDPALNVDCAIYKKIAEVRPELAFQCGALYFARLNNMPARVKL